MHDDNQLAACRLGYRIFVDTLSYTVTETHSYQKYWISIVHLKNKLKDQIK